MEAVDHHSVLGVAVGATAEQIREAYQARLHELRVAMRSGNAPPAETIDGLRKAFIVLSDTVTRPLHETAAPAPVAPAEVSVPPATSAAGEAPVAPVVPVAAATALASAQEPHAAPHEFPFSFAGSGVEYFRIWIVNLFLSIVTLGIYSVWAKVRREKYLHRAMLLDGSAFEYHGTPRAIFRGRALAVLIFAGLSAAQHVSNEAYWGLLLLLTPLVPWFAVRAFRFRAHNTSYRGIRFAFHGTYRQAMTAIVGYGALTMLTFGLTYPYWYAKMRLFVFDNLSYGTARLSSRTDAGALSRVLFKQMFVGGLMFVVLGVLFGVIIGVFGLAVESAVGGSADIAAKGSATHGFGAVIFSLATLAFFVFYAQYMRAMFVARTARLLLDGASLGQAELRSRPEPGVYLMIALKNLALMVVTLGLYAPYAHMRLVRYRVETLSVMVPDGLDRFVGDEQGQEGALGDEASEVFDLDIGF